MLPGGAEWCRGIVDRVNADGSYDVLYDDGDSKPRVSPDLIRLPMQQAASGRSGHAEGRRGTGNACRGDGD